jgi:hypothetical protein
MASKMALPMAAATGRMAPSPAPNAIAPTMPRSAILVFPGESSHTRKAFGAQKVTVAA